MMGSSSFVHKPLPESIASLERKLNDHIYQFYQGQGEPTLEILFFHGLQVGHGTYAYRSTWTSGDGPSQQVWPATWLVEEFPNSNIFSMSYDCKLDLPRLAENLMHAITWRPGIGQRCPVILVGHSFGGLVIKELCVKAHQIYSRDPNSEKNKKIGNFLRNMAGIFFYATPHQGIHSIGKLAAYLLDGSNNGGLLDYIMLLSAKSARLDDDFSHIRRKDKVWHIASVGELLPTSWGRFNGIVVPEASARYGNQFSTIKASHISICKPSERTSNSFQHLIDFITMVKEEETKAQDELRQQEEARAREEAQPRNLQQLPKQMVGIGFRVKQVQSKLENVTMLGLVGMGGVGKTTLAMGMFNELGRAFEYTCFVPEVKLIRGTMDKIKEEVWKRMHRHGRKVEETDDWFTLRGKRLLLVLDDISDDRDVAILSSIADHSSLESRFIATSRDRELLKQLENIYEVPFLDEKDSNELFMSCAFPKGAIMPPRLASVMAAIVKKCGGLPLTLEVLGRYLKTKKDNKYWEQTLQALDKAEAVTDLNKRLWETLRLSYDGLQEKEQQMFLDASTFFTGSSFLLRDAKAAWRKTYGTDSESLLWQTLVDKCLVDDVRDNEHIKVHEQLRSLGKKIAAESSNNGNCRVWEKPMALRLLQTTDQADNKEFHSLQIKNDEDDNYRIHITSGALHKLKKVRFLEIDAPVVLDASREDDSSLNELVLLKCVGFQIFNLALQSCLVGVHLSISDLEFLPSTIGQLSSLRVFVLCEANLENVPNEIGHLLQLEHLEFRRCRSLRNLPESFGQLSALNYLGFMWCERLESLPESFGQLSALNKLSFYECGSLESLPESFGQLSALNELSFEECDRLESLPESFGQLSALNDLEFIWCKRMGSLPESFGQLSALNDLEFMWCKHMGSLPESFGQLSALNKLSFYECGSLESLPESFGQLSALNELSFYECGSLESLPESFGQLSALNKLRFRVCERLESLPKSFGQLSALNDLEFMWCKCLESLPELFGQLSALNKLSFYKCGHLESLPKSFGQLLALNKLEFRSCGSLKSLPESFGQLSALNELSFEECYRLESLPESFGQLSALNKLTFRFCGRLKSLPESFGQLSALNDLEFMWCTHLESLPESFGQLSALNKLKFKYCSLERLPELLALRHLIVHGVLMKSIPDFIESMPSLHTLELAVLPYVKALPAWLGDRDVLPLGRSGKIFQIQDGCFSLTHEETVDSMKVEDMISMLDGKAIVKVRASDYEGAVADLCPDDLGEMQPALKAFLLQERGIVKRFLGDLHGALEDLTIALEVLSQGDDLLSYGYNCWKHRGFVNFMLGDLDSAQNDGSKALKIVNAYNFRSMISPSLGDESVMYMHFRLKGTEEIQEERKRLPHAQIMEKVRATDFLGALAIWDAFDASVSGYHDRGFFLQERGILKRFTGDLKGALEDLTTALEVLSQRNDLRHYGYNCWKHRGFVNFMLGDLDGAQNDGSKALKIVNDYNFRSMISPSLGDESVMYMHFRLKGTEEIQEERKRSPHDQIMEKVRASNFLGALAIWDAFDARVSGYYDRVWFLQERGILKRVTGDLKGALEDLSSALEIDDDDYECCKHRGYVKYLLGDLDGARIDAERCKVMGLKEASDNCLGSKPVAFLEFEL